MIYGHNKTIHGTQHVDVEVRNGEVVAVWFRCCMIPFKQCNIGVERAEEMREESKRVNEKFKLNAVDIEIDDK